MKVIELIDKIFLPVLVGSTCLVALTFVSYMYAPEQDHWEFHHYLLWIVDLQKERNLAAWFEGCLFLLCGLSFSVIGWSDRAPQFITERYIWVARIAACAACFFSADEILSIHEGLGIRLENRMALFQTTPIAEFGFSWLFLYIPPVAIGLVAVYRLYNAMLSNVLKHHTLRRRTRVLTYLGVGIVPVIFLMEGLEGYILMSGQPNTIVPCFEEAFEVLALLLFTRINTNFASTLDL